jgi:hypothetical protein
MWLAIFWCFCGVTTRASEVNFSTTVESESHSLVLRVHNTIRLNPVVSVDKLESKQDMLAWESFKFRVLCEVITAVPEVLAGANVDRHWVTQAHGVVIYAQLENVLGRVTSQLRCPCTMHCESFSNRKLPLHGNWRGERSCGRENALSTPAQTTQSASNPRERRRSDCQTLSKAPHAPPGPERPKNTWSERLETPRNSARAR